MLHSLGRETARHRAARTATVPDFAVALLLVDGVRVRPGTAVTGEIVTWLTVEIAGGD